MSVPLQDTHTSQVRPRLACLASVFGVYVFKREPARHTADRKASVASSLSVLTVLARLFDLFQVGGLEHGADLLRGVDDDAAEGIEAVHQADVDPRQGNVGGFFLPL